MDVEVTLPQWGMGMQEATVLKWHHDVGDVVAEDDPLVEMEAEKVTADIVAPAAGTLREVRFAAEDVVQVGAVMAIIATG